MRSRIIIGAVFLIVSIILCMLGSCGIDLWILIASAAAVCVILLLQYRQKKNQNKES